MDKLLLSLTILFSHVVYATGSGLQQNLQRIETSWAHTYYSNSDKEKQASTYRQLIEQTEQILQQHPDEPDVLFCLAMIKASMAEHESAISALKTIVDVKELLTKVIDTNPKTMHGSAYVILGTLYYRVPAWPVSFGDNQQAEVLLQTALTINPNGVDSNYFYAKYLVANDRNELAKDYFRKAMLAIPRHEQHYADQQLKEEARRALQHIEHQDNNTHLKIIH